MSEGLKFCVDCKWARYWAGPTVCILEKVADRDLVTGQVLNPWCKDVRVEACGREGKYWEAKE